MKHRTTHLPLTSLSLFAALALLPSCSDGTAQTSTSSGSGSSGDMSSSSSSNSSSSGMGGNGGSATGGMGGAGGNSTGGMGGNASGGMGGNGGSGSCTPGTTDFCYSGPPGTEIKGVCKAGIQTCLPDGTYGPCMGEIVPSPESCLTMGDDDCDGMVNEDCNCTPNTTAPCYSGPMGTLNVGDCKAGVQTCNGQGTAYGPCIGEVLPQAESCSMPGDENCNGQINESGAGCVCVPNTTAACYSGPMGTQNVGDCKAGIQTCNGQGTAYGPCIGEIVPQMETCALPGDEDCDGMVNESGAMCVCVPNSVAPCYSGPMGTQNVGECKAGMQTCNAQGTAYGACMGEVTPQSENCGLPGDENCNGLANENCNATWMKTLGGPLDDDIYDVAVDSSGNVIVVGAFSGTVDFGGGPFTTPNGNTDIFVAKYDANGTHVWSKQYGANGIDRAHSVAVDPLGNIVVSGIFQSTVDFGGGPYMSVGGSHDIFVLALNPSGGYLLSRAFGGSGGDEGSAVAFDSQSNVILAGHMTGTIDFGGGPLTSAGGDDGFVVKYSSFGAHVWSKRFGDASAQNIKGVAANAAGDIYITGAYSGTVDFGGGPVTSADTDAMLVKFSSTGTYLWGRYYAGTGAQNGNGVAVDPAGNIVVAGQIQGTVDFGLGMQTSAGLSDMFVAKYTNAGTPAFAKVFGDANPQVAWGVATDSQSNVVFGGSMSGTVDLGGGALVSGGGNDMFAAKFNAAGTHTWSRRAGDSLEQQVRAVATDSANNVYAVGRFQGTANFGNGNTASIGGYDAFIVKYAP